MDHPSSYASAPAEKVFGLILCGGASRRMGAVDKAELILSERRMVDVAVETLCAQLSPVLLSASHDYGLGLKTLPDLQSGPRGPVAGLYAAWQYMQENNYSAVITAPVDGPNLPNNLFSRLKAVGSSAVARDDVGRHPCFGLWQLTDLSRAFAQLALDQSISMNQLADLCGATDVAWGGDDTFININTLEDVAAFQSQARRT
ncbi:molybdenum cofactor guanylyltransferase [Litorimonas sp. RW-G-Af-16]|uniref:molybdenum cofactor guanylyltransferase n=1 Tax=Litorimonas sp. RW-G-Af-16 TaxID=3241168 RepID=UPI00390C8F6E